MKNLVWTDSRILSVIAAQEVVAIELFNHQRDPGPISREANWHNLPQHLRDGWREEARRMLEEAQSSFEP